MLLKVTFRSLATYSIGFGFEAKIRRGEIGLVRISYVLQKTKKKGFAVINLSSFSRGTDR